MIAQTTSIMTGEITVIECVITRVRAGLIKCIIEIIIGTQVVEVLHLIQEDLEEGMVNNNYNRNNNTWQINNNPKVKYPNEHENLILENHYDHYKCYVKKEETILITNGKEERRYSLKDIWTKSRMIDIIINT